MFYGIIEVGWARQSRRRPDGGSMLEIALLGQFSVTLDGNPAALTTRPAQLLLAALLLRAGLPQPRELLADRLWPDSTAINARANLRHTLWQLRSVLEPGGDGRTDGVFIHSDPREITFNHDSPYTLDVELLERERPPEMAARTPTAELMAAVAVYRGELLPGFFEPWIVLERERLLAVFERRTAQLLDRLVQERRWNDAIEWAERWISLGEAPEPAYRALMRAHAARGDLGHVMGTYRRCCEALREDLGVRPSPETRQLAQELALGGPLQAFDAAAPATTPLPEPAPLTLDDALAQVELEQRRAENYRRAARRAERRAWVALLALSVVGMVAALLSRPASTRARSRGYRASP